MTHSTYQHRQKFWGPIFRHTSRLGRSRQAGVRVSMVFRSLGWDFIGKKWEILIPWNINMEIYGMMEIYHY